MMKEIKIIVLIEEIEENGETYYLATSNDVPGFLCEGDTIDEVLKETPAIIKGLIIANYELAQKKRKKHKESNSAQVTFSFVPQTRQLQFA